MTLLCPFKLSFHVILRALEVLHDMQDSKARVFMKQNRRVEYMLLPHNNDVTKPRALNTFLSGLAGQESIRV